jgi:CDP-diglyceride synthetase
MKLQSSKDSSRRNIERAFYLLSAIAILLAGLASRRFRSSLPPFLAEYAGDTLWALMLFLMVSVLMTSQPLKVRATTSLALSYLVEFSQLYHATWIDSIRQTTLGGLIIGFGFLWSDLVCYSIGIALGAATEMCIRRTHRPKTDK